MVYVAGVDGTRDGWAVVIQDGDALTTRKVAVLSDLLNEERPFAIIAVDIPIGLLDAYEVGGRACDRAARQALGRPRGSSVFPAPIRPVLTATTWEEACLCSRNSSANGKALTKQTFAILPKIREVDQLLQSRPELQEVIKEVHPEVCFRELAPKPMAHSKATPSGRDERRQALKGVFPEWHRTEEAGLKQGLKSVDILDAGAACWSARRCAEDGGYCLPRSGFSPPDAALFDSTGLRMAIWV
ncbi:hypothetical protein AMST5_02150 [freshwater sediment metagenome]|uniref:DUF429 domain-containing protein n=1 Tax=freshwater sediment metagenome TaxID=556182 RepID=A0AA48LZJ0_9ZZZZ